MNKALSRNSTNTWHTKRESNRNKGKIHKCSRTNSTKNL